MPKPTENATSYCLILTLLALIGIIVGLIAKSPLVVTIFLLPTVAYEVYRTEGESTKFASWALLIILILELIFLIFHINYNLAKFLGTDEQYVAGYWVPLGDIKVVAPTIMAIMSIILFIRTYGKYTKWLAVIIFVTAFVIVYTISPEIFKNLARLMAGEGLKQIQY